MFLVFSYSKLFFLHFLLILSFFVFNYTFGQQQFGYSDNSFYPSINQQLPFSSFPAYGKYFYFTPYGNYGESGYEGPAFGINSYWQPGIANYPSGYGQQGGYNPSLQCLDQLTNCALQASSGKCTYSPNTLANCPMSCGVPCPSSNHLNDYYYNNGGNPLPQSSLSSGVYKGWQKKIN
uniref:ShKT domain-containing protein n=1 Tax=Meloidogyne hapla TaxID=6305 RepID=A0A1I8BZE7_MELHA